jgi:hypothetical protein
LPGLLSRAQIHPKTTKNFGTVRWNFAKWNSGMPDSDFKFCPYCKERIRTSAVKCRYCGEWLEKPIEQPLAAESESSAILNQTGEADRLTENQIEKPTVSQLNQQPQAADQVAPPAPPRPTTDAPQQEPLFTKEKTVEEGGSYFVRHWRGDLSLGVSYWVNCMLLCVAYTVGFLVILQIGMAINPWSAVPLVVATWLFYIIVVDSEGNVSDAIDIVVFDRHFSPFLFRQEGVCYIPAESVLIQFFLSFLAKLQMVGSVPAMDIRAYAGRIGSGAES